MMRRGQVSQTTMRCADARAGRAATPAAATSERRSGLERMKGLEWMVITGRSDNARRERVRNGRSGCSDCSGEHLDGRSDPGCLRQSSVARDERRSKSFGERDIRRVIRSQVVAQLPDARHERFMGVPLDGEDREEIEGYTR